MNSFQSKKKKSFHNWFFYLKLFFFFVFFCVLIFLNFFFKVKNVKVEFLDEKESNKQSENIEIKNYIEKIVKQEANNLINFLRLDDDLISKFAHDEYQVVNNVRISRKLNLDVNVLVFKNDEYFYTCLPEEFNFLVSCMLGNSEGIFYKELSDESFAKEKNILKIDINKKVLFQNKLDEIEDRIEDPDSLSGTRIYTSNDFQVLKEILSWLLKNGFEINKVYTDELKIVDIYTNFYIIKVSLDKSFPDTVKDFELISKTGKLQKYINDENVRQKLEYIDLSFKDKVFWKLKNDKNENLETATKTDIMSTTTNAQQ